MHPLLQPDRGCIASVYTTVMSSDAKLGEQLMRLLLPERVRPGGRHRPGMGDSSNPRVMVLLPPSLLLRTLILVAVPFLGHTAFPQIHQTAASPPAKGGGGGAYMLYG